MASHGDFSRENRSQLNLQQQGMSGTLQRPADISLQLAFLSKGHSEYLSSQQHELQAARRTQT